jgi:hypothetical protein
MVSHKHTAILGAIRQSPAWSGERRSDHGTIFRPCDFAGRSASIDMGIVCVRCVGGHVIFTGPSKHGAFRSS